MAEMARDVAEMEVEEMAVDAGTLEGPKVDEGDGCIRSCLVKFDLAVSSPIFEARLPSVLEWALSVPGSIFGMPLPMTMSPLVMASADSTVASALCLELAVFLIAWVVFVPRGELRLLCKTDAALLALIVGNLYLVQCYNLPAFGIAAFSVGVFSAVVGVVAPIKQYTQRLRPNFAAPNIVRFAQPRHLPIGPSAVQSTKSDAKKRRDQHASLPSGDAASCGAMCATLLLAAEDAAWHRTLAACTAMLVLCCLGRMYWRHHHFLDVLCGSVIGAGVACALFSVVGFGCGWLHVLVLCVSGAAMNEFTTS